MNSIAVASVIFPENLKFFNFFLKSLDDQTERKFDLILINDSCSEKKLEKYLKKTDLSFTIINAKTNKPLEIRLELLDYLEKSDYNIIVFADTDDYFSKNRIELSVREIKENEADVVFNDITLVTDKGQIIKEKIWKKRAPFIKVDLNFLMEQNVLGLSNTAIKKELLKSKIKIDNMLPVFDWIFYVQLFSKFENISCKYIPTETFYRQHENNTLGLEVNYTSGRIKKLFSMKEKIYSFYKTIDIQNVDESRINLERFKKFVFQNKESLNEYISKLNKREELFWFEEIKL